MDVVLDEPDIKETEDESIEEMIPEEKHLPEEEPVVFSEEEPAGQPEDEGMDTLEPVVDERSDSSGPDSPIEEVETGPDAERKKPARSGLPLFLCLYSFLCYSISGFT